MNKSQLQKGAEISNVIEFHKKNLSKLNEYVYSVTINGKGSHDLPYTMVLKDLIDEEGKDLVKKFIEDLKEIHKRIISQNEKAFKNL